MHTPSNPIAQALRCAHSSCPRCVKGRTEACNLTNTHASRTLPDAFARWLGARLDRPLPTSPRPPTGESSATITPIHLHPQSILYHPQSGVYRRSLPFSLPVLHLSLRRPDPLPRTAAQSTSSSFRIYSALTLDVVPFPITLPSIQYSSIPLVLHGQLAQPSLSTATCLALTPPDSLLSPPPSSR